MTKKTKLLLSLGLLLLLIPGSLIAQVSLNMRAPSPYAVTLENLLNPVIICTEKEYGEVILVGKVLDGGKNLIAEFRTNSFILSNKITVINHQSIGLVSQNYYNQDFQRLTELTGYFPSGGYTLCTSLITGGESNNLTEKCLDVNILPLQPPRLTYPQDKSKIRIKYPFFSWLPVIGGNLMQSSQIRYQINVTGIFEGQSSYEALVNNASLLSADGISNSFYMYPTTSLPLTVGNKYLWQVKAYLGTSLIGESEIWEFEVIEDTIKVQEREKEGSFITLSRTKESGYYYVSGNLRFSFDGEYAPQELKILIYDESGNVITPKTNHLKQNFGNNQYNIDLTKYRKMKHESFYTLEVSNEKNEKYYLTFKYLNPDRN